jgi:hypothetical protein
MIKDNFYICVKVPKGEREVKDKYETKAKRVSGYTEGNVGLHKQPDDFWIASHLPTGLRISPILSKNKTRKEALREALKLINERQDYKKLVDSFMESENYKQFAQSKYDQTVTTVF